MSNARRTAAPAIRCGSRHLAWTLLAVLAASGCTHANGARLSGKVTLDRTPVETGRIRLTPLDGQGPTAEALILQGRYALTTSPGAKKIEIYGLRKIGTRHYHENDPSSPMVDVTEEIVPARYNTHSGLTAELKTGSETRDFNLETGADDGGS